jgi:hypothetical protein
MNAPVRISNKMKILKSLENDPNKLYSEIALEIGCSYRWVKMVARDYACLPKRAPGRRRKETVAKIAQVPTITPHSDPEQLP